MTTPADGTAAAIVDSVTSSAERDDGQKTSGAMEVNARETTGTSKPESKHVEETNVSADEANGAKDEKAVADIAMAEQEKGDAVQPQTDAGIDADRKGEKDEATVSAEREVDKNGGSSDKQGEGDGDRKNEDKDKAEGAEGDSKDASAAKRSGRPYQRRPPVNQSKFDPSVLETSSDPVEIRKQVEFYFSDSNLPGDKFLLEKVGGEANNPVDISLVHGFKRMKHFQPYEAVVAALKESQLLEVIDDKAIKRKVPLSKELVAESVHEGQKLVDDMTLPRSVYVKGFGAETPTTQFEVEAFFAPFGPYNAIRLRRTATRLFKGSVFVEFADEATQQAFLALNPKPKWKGKALLIMSKSAYVEKKAAEIKAGKLQPGQKWAQADAERRKAGWTDRRRGGGGRGRGGANESSSADWRKRREEDSKRGFRGGPSRQHHNNNNNHRNNSNSKGAQQDGGKAEGEKEDGGSHERRDGEHGGRRGGGSRGRGGHRGRGRGRGGGVGGAGRGGHRATAEQDPHTIPEVGTTTADDDLIPEGPTKRGGGGGREKAEEAGGAAAKAPPGEEAGEAGRAGKGGDGGAGTVVDVEMEGAKGGQVGQVEQAGAAGKKRARDEAEEGAAVEGENGSKKVRGEAGVELK